MMLGMGDTATPTTATTPAVGSQAAAPSFTTGLMLWTSPASAFQYLQATASSPSTAFSSAMLPSTLGVLLPIALIAVLIGSRK